MRAAFVRGGRMRPRDVWQEAAPRGGAAGKGRGKRGFGPEERAAGEKPRRRLFPGSPAVRAGHEKVEVPRLRPGKTNIVESLILAQNERWRRVLSMQVERQAGAIRARAADW